MMRLRNSIGALLMAAALLFITALPAQAQRRCPTCIGCEFAYADETAGQVSAEHGQTRRHFGTTNPLTAGTGELGEHQRFLINYLFRGDENIGGILPAMMLMSQQLTAVAMKQMLIIGTFFDAKHQLETQQLFREMAAAAHKTYRPSTGMCIIGTNVRSLATAESHARMNGFIFARRALQRQFGAANTVGADGPVIDNISRLDNFRRNYCDRYDNNFIIGDANDTGLSILCQTSTIQTLRTVNSDVDYTVAVELPRTMLVDLTRNNNRFTAVSEDEANIFTLSTNLFANRVFRRLSNNELMIMANHGELRNVRALIAKRSVVQNTLSAIVGMKSQGSAAPAGGNAGANSGIGSSEDTAQYMRHFMRELGMTYDPDMMHMVGDHANYPLGLGISEEVRTQIRPSYYAQMEMLTKRLYQSPQFFTDLYDSPANVKRKGAALQAIGLMLDRDLHDSYLRSEMLMSLLLEMRLVRAQREAVSSMSIMGIGEDSE